MLRWGCGHRAGMGFRQLGHAEGRGVPPLLLPPLADFPAADDCGDTPQSRRLACPLGRHNDDWEMGVMHDLGAGRAQGEAPPYA